MMVGEVVTIMNRLEKVREAVNDILEYHALEEDRGIAFIHLYGVSTFCSLLAIKRGLEPEMCAVAGMLHDIWTYKTGDSKGHAMHGAIEAKKIISELGIFTKEETKRICQMISTHSKKREFHDEYGELLKDADTLQHYLYNPSFKVIKKEKDRLLKLLKELGLVDSVG